MEQRSGGMSNKNTNCSLVDVMFVESLDREEMMAKSISDRKGGFSYLVRILCRFCCWH